MEAMVSSSDLMTVGVSMISMSLVASITKVRLDVFSVLGSAVLCSLVSGSSPSLSQGAEFSVPENTCILESFLFLLERTEVRDRGAIRE